MKQIAPLLALGLALPALAAWESDVRYANGTVTGYPARQQRATEVAMDVIETEGCAVGSRAGASLSLPDPCGFVRGLYRYRSGERQTLVEFTAMRHPGGHVFLVAEPIEISAD